MTKKQIIERIFSFYKEGNLYAYKSFEARALFIKGVSFQKLALYKWLFVKECKLKDVPVYDLHCRCGYCFNYICNECPLLKKTIIGTNSCCGGIIDHSSDGVSLADIEFIINLIKADMKKGK